VRGVQATDAGRDELAGAVEVESARQAEAAEDVVTDLETTVTVFLGLELAPQGLTGGIIAGQQQAGLGVIRAEPGMGTAVEKEQFSFVFAALAAATVLASTPRLAVTQGPEPATQRFIGKVDVVVLSEDVGEMEKLNCA
jgi:nucleoid-associated protein YgaU